jgi:hypothetical protein
MQLLEDDAWSAGFGSLKLNCKGHWIIRLSNCQSNYMRLWESLRPSPLPQMPTSSTDPMDWMVPPKVCLVVSQNWTMPLHIVVVCQCRFSVSLFLTVMLVYNSVETWHYNWFLLWNTVFNLSSPRSIHYHVHKIQSVDSVFTQPNSAFNFGPYFNNILINIIIRSTLRPSSRLV